MHRSGSSPARTSQFYRLIELESSVIIVVLLGCCLLVVLLRQHWLRGREQATSERDKGISVKQTVIKLIDDLDGSTAEETIKFAIDDQLYEIDLSRANALKLRRTFERYQESARRHGGIRLVRPGQAGVARSRSARQTRSARIRAWAAANDLTVQPSGRLPQFVIDRYEAAHA